MCVRVCVCGCEYVCVGILCVCEFVRVRECVILFLCLCECV